MEPKVEDVMCRLVLSVEHDTPVGQVASVMRDAQVGDVLITREGKLTGILTDRDIVVRGLAAGLSMQQTTAGELCSIELVTIGPGATAAEAAEVMRRRAIRRLPVVEGGRAVGVVSLGDLALAREPTSVLAGISAAPPSA